MSTKQRGRNDNQPGTMSDSEDEDENEWEDILYDDDHTMWDSPDEAQVFVTNDRTWVMQSVLNATGEPLERIIQKELKNPNLRKDSKKEDENNERATALFLKYKNNGKTVEWEERTCTMNNLAPGMIVKVTPSALRSASPCAIDQIGYNQTVPADILPLVVTNPHQARDNMFFSTKGYNNVEARIVWNGETVLDEIYTGNNADPLEELKKWRFYARCPTSSFALDKWKGLVTYQREDSEQKMLDAYNAGDYNKMRQDSSGDALGSRAQAKYLDIHDHTLVNRSPDPM